jgi:hypothetical protein
MIFGYRGLVVIIVRYLLLCDARHTTLFSEEIESHKTGYVGVGYSTACGAYCVL